MKHHGFASQFVDYILLLDYDIVLEAVKQHGLALQRALTESKARSEIVKQFILRNGFALRYAYDALQADHYSVYDAITK